VEVISRDGGTEVVMSRIKELVAGYGVERLVVGLPRNMNGTLGERGEKSKAFAEKIGCYVSLPVEMWDERLSTVAAERVLLEANTSRAKRKKVIDKLAASIILQGYLDAAGNKKEV
jgi:putative Holliday junction resolvase